MSRSDIDEASVPLLETHRDPSVRGVKARTVAHTDTEVRPTSQGFAALGSNDSLGGGGETMRRTISQLIPAGRDVQATNPNAEPAKIDWGFDKQGFDLGSIATIKASDDLLHQQPPLSCSSAAGRCLGLTLAGLSVVGLPYVFCQCRVVPAGKLALCRGIGGNVRIVEPGCNCLEFACSKVKMFDVTTDQIDLGPMHIIRILPGQLGMASVNGRPYLMEPGRHAVNDAMFQFHGTASLRAPYINIGTIHVVLVPEGMTAVCKVGGEGHFLESGRHEINNPNFSFDPATGFYNNNTEHINICSKHRIVVPSGKLGLAFSRGKAKVLNPCQVYNVDSPYFTYSGSVSLSQNQIIHGDIKIIMVQDGKLGISFDDGQLKILTPGRHILDRPTHVFYGFLGTGQETLPINEVTGMSRDNVGLCFDAAITVQVVDGTKAVPILGSRGGSSESETSSFSYAGFRENIIQKARLALSIIVGNNKFNASMAAFQKPKSNTGDLSGLEHQHDFEEQGSSFRQHIHDVFMDSFSRNMLDQCGVEVIDMSIEDIRITNAELASAMARGAVKQTELEMANIDRRVREMQATTLSRANCIEAEGQARAIDIMAKAEAARIREVDAALASSCATSQQRELVGATGAALEKARSSVVMGADMRSLGSMFASGMSVPGLTGEGGLRQ
eukprot:INCI910.1.p1 GENE.INCI910.1~~INCI910.1.p1  ORF type:complete len:713 (+),score=132.37 INCI910.1:127-2139(+)